MRKHVLLLLAVVVAAGTACNGRVEPVIDAEQTPAVYAEDFLRIVNASPAVLSAGGAPGLRTIAVATDDPERRVFRVTVDAAEQVLRIDTPIERDYGFERKKTIAPRLYPSFAAADLDHGSFLCAAVLGVKAKAFDDGLCAALELAIDAGIGGLAARRGFLRRLRDTVSAADEGGVSARARLAVASQLGGGPVDAAAEVSGEATRMLTAFRADARLSQPLGFYTWSQELVQIFQRDRVLQATLERPPASALATALAKDGGLLDTYDALLTLAERLTNPLAHGDLREAARALASGREPILPDPVSLFPPSRSHETALVKILYGNRPIPAGFSLADAMVERIRAGSLDLEPTAASGWYDHQLFALESLVIPEQMPEAKHLYLTDAYRKDLVGLFRSLLALTRETHVEYLEGPVCGARIPGEMIVLDLRPSLSVEPVATYYLRRARSYRFVRGVLEEACGPEALSGLFRLTAGGPVNLPLAVELRLMEALCHGAYLTACAELGLRPEAEVEADLGFGQGPATDRAVFQRWAAQIEDDPDLGRDVRMMVPVYYDIERRKTKVWAVLGVATKPLSVSFEKRPTVLAVDEITDGEVATIPVGEVSVEFAGEDHRLGYLVTAELYVTRLLDRKQFRALCNRHRTAERILEELRG